MSQTPLYKWSTTIKKSDNARVPKELALDVTSLGRRTLHGLMWMLGQNVLARVCSFLSQIALAALLAPADFGVIGLSYTVINIASALTNIGIDEVIIQRNRALRFWAGPVFWISFGIALLAGVLVTLFAPVAAIIYKTPELIGLVAVLALSMPIGALSTLPGMMVRARMHFGFFAIYGTLETVAVAVITVAFAWGGLGVYSFVVPIPIAAAVRALVWWKLAAPGVNIRLKLKRWKYMVGKTAITFTSRTLLAIIGQGDYVVLGLTTNHTAVGSYYFAFRLAAQPLWMLAGNFSGVLFPVLVQFKSDPSRQGAAALKASTLLSFCIMPLAFIQAGIAEPLVTSFFGQKWALSVPMIQLLSVGLALDAVSWIAGTLINARGEFRAGLNYLLFQTPIFFILVFIGSLLDNAVGVAWAVFIYYAVTQPVFVWAVYKRLNITALQVSLIYLKPMSYAAIAVGFGLAISLLPVFADHPLVRVVIIGVLGVAVYTALVRWLASEVWNELWSRVTNAFGRHAAPAVLEA